MRIVAWNIENLAPWLEDDHLEHRVRELGQPDVLCLQEVRIRPSDTTAVERMRILVRGYTCHFSLCDDPKNVTNRGGRAHGVVTYARIPGVSHAPAWDREGRVLVTQFDRLAVINLYGVNGTPKPYRDPETGEPDGDRHDYKRRVQDRLFELAARYDPLVIAGDWNVSRTPIDAFPRLRTESPHAKARAELEAHLERSRLVDVYRALHPDERAYTWFARGRYDFARVDYIVASPQLRVRSAEILTELRGDSDHAPIAAEFG